MFQCRAGFFSLYFVHGMRSQSRYLNVPGVLEPIMLTERGHYEL